jgi:hypothetical protein
MTNKTTTRVVPIGIRWPTSDEELSSMDRGELDKVLASAKDGLESKVTEALAFIEKFGGPRKSDEKTDVLDCLMAAELYRVVTIHAATFNVLNCPSPELAGD